MAELPTGTVTFLFSDIEGSTRLLHELGDRYAGALEQHRRLLRAAFGRHGGVEVGTEGDSFFVAFARARDGLAAAAEGQRALASHRWPDDLPFRVRMGLHTGEALVTDSNYVGVDVHRAARVMAAGHGGQIVLSQTTADLTADDLPEATSLRDLGEHSLKDLTLPQRLFQLSIEGLSDAFPALKTLGLHPTNLPAQPTPLIGREREVSELEALLARSDVRLVTLTGPGGTGKTRLALQVGAELIEGFAAGVFVVDLAPIRDPALVLATVAQALALREQPGQTLEETLSEYLRDKELLLLLDNLEQLLDVAPKLAEVLAATSRLKLLATSRSPLRLAAEQHYPLETLAEEDALTLFLARARAARPDFELDGQRETVEEICRRLDNLPLAIELAAARVRAVSPDAILARLESRLRLLTGGARDLPVRQQTLRAAIDWSYDLLSDEERALFRRLGVFVGGCALEAAEAVCDSGGELAIDVLDGLTSLVDKSLLRPGGEVSGEPRFWMLETIREYATDRLLESDELEELRRRHAEHLLSLAEESTKVAYGGDQALWWARLDADHDNLRAALEWSGAAGEIETELRLVTALWYFWAVRGFFNEGRQRLEAAIARSGSARNVLRAAALSAAGQLAYRQGDYAHARAFCAESLDSCRELGDELGTARGLVALANIAVAEGDYEHAMAEYEAARGRFQELGDKGRLGTVVANMGAVANMQRDFELGRSLGEEALALHRELGNSEAATISLHNLARIDLRTGRLADAADLFRQSLESARELDYPELIALCLEACAELAEAEDPDRAARLLGAADALFEELGVTKFGDEAESYDETVRTLEAHLGEQAFEAARAEGRAMTLDDAAADAFDLLDAERADRRGPSP
ncbi:MAG: ATP-binding protein [Gaiellaceae bacterium]